MRSALLALLIAFSCYTQHGRAQEAKPLTFHGAINTYYSYSALQPPDNQRAYTTQPARNGTFAVDLATMGVDWSAPRVDLRFSLQAGTWVDANYVSNDASWKYIREAFVQVNADSVLFLAAGILPSVIGHESSVNAENMLLSRSLNADATPYYMAGFGFAYVPSSQVRIAVYAINGWQMIVDNNEQLSFGSQLEWLPTEHTTLSWRTYIGNDEPVGAARLRIHNNAWVDHAFSTAVRTVLMGDVSLLENRDTQAFDVAWYLALKGSWKFTDLLRVGGRVEVMTDPKNALIRSGPPAEIVGASIGLDVLPISNVMIRCEVRSLNAGEPIFPSASGTDNHDIFGTVALSAAF